MAIFSPSALIGEIRNKVGSNVFTRGRSGATVRLRVTPHNPSTAAQASVRANLTDASRAFKELGASDLALWQDYGQSLTYTNRVNGTSYHPSAIDIFCKLSTKFLQITPGGTIPVAPPTGPYTPDTITITAADDVGAIEFTASAAIDAGEQVEVLIQKLASPNRVANPNGYRSAGFYSPAAMALTFTTSALVPGTYAVAYRLVNEDTGEAGPIHILPYVTVT